MNIIAALPLMLTGVVDDWPIIWPVVAMPAVEVSVDAPDVEHEPGDVIVRVEGDYRAPYHLTWCEMCLGQRLRGLGFSTDYLNAIARGWAKRDFALRQWVTLYENEKNAPPAGPPKKAAANPTSSASACPGGVCPTRLGARLFRRWR